MNGCNSTEIDETNLTDKTKFRLNEVTKIENYFNLEINQRKSCIKNLMKYVSGFGYIDKILIVLSATSGGLCIIFSVSVVGVPTGIAGASLSTHVILGCFHSKDDHLHHFLLSIYEQKNIKQRGKMVREFCAVLPYILLQIFSLLCLSFCFLFKLIDHFQYQDCF